MQAQRKASLAALRTQANTSSLFTACGQIVRHIEAYPYILRAYGHAWCYNAISQNSSLDSSKLIEQQIGECQQMWAPVRHLQLV